MLESRYKMNLIKIGLKIAYYRKLCGMTQEELAERCGLSAGYISQLEGPNSFFCPSIKTLFKITQKEFFDEENEYPIPISEIAKECKKLDKSSLESILAVVKNMTK